MEEKQAVDLFLRTRSEESFCALFEALYPRVRRYFLVRSLDRMTAEELAQNVLLKVYNRSQELRERDLFNGWLFKVARNELLAYWRRNFNATQTIEYEPLEEDLANELTTGTAGVQFDDWMTSLDPAERELTRLRFIEELSYEELAVAFDVPMGTVKWRLFNVKKKLSHIISASMTAPNS